MPNWAFLCELKFKFNSSDALSFKKLVKNNAINIESSKETKKAI